MANIDDIDELVLYLLEKDLEEEEAAASNTNYRRFDVGHANPDPPAHGIQLNSSLESFRSDSTGSFSGEIRVASSPATPSNIQCYEYNLDISTSDSLAGAGQGISEVTEENIVNLFHVPFESSRGDFSQRDAVQSNTSDTSDQHNVGFRNWRSVPQKRPRSTSLGAEEGNCGKKENKPAEYFPQRSPAAADTVAGPSRIRRQINENGKEKPFPCDVCDKAFAYRSEFEIHYRTHAGEKPFDCPECPKSFSRKSNLTTHLRTHTGERAFECGVCGKKFAQKITLTKHLRTHTGEKPYMCELCGREFVDRSHCSRHEKNKSCRK